MTPQELQNRFETILFKMDSKGELRFWALEEQKNDEEKIITLIIYHGLLSSELYPKETLIWSRQADGPYYVESYVEERRTRYATQVNRKGYTREIPTVPPDKPMLCLDYNKHHDYFDHNEAVFVQPKLDGMRCISIDGKLFSRDGEPILGVPHIKPPPGKWDGELYVHGWSFEQNISVARSRTPHALHRAMIYHVFDAVTDDDQTDRIALTHETFEVNRHENIKWVQTHVVPYTKEAMESIHNKVTSQGYEGIIIRAMHGKYEPNKRSKYLQKYKKFQDDWFPLVGIDEGTGSAAGQAIFICKLPSGATFRCVPSMERNTRRFLFKEKERFIGNYQVHVRFLNYTEDKVPRHPVGVDICLIASKKTANTITGQDQLQNHGETQKEDSKNDQS